METNLEKIKSLAKIKEDENWRFRSFLKMQEDPDRIDRIVNSLNEKYSSLIDCTECGNCCTDLQPLIRKKDLTGLKNEITTRLFSVVNNYSICPIVFNVYEELKVKLHFK